MAGWVGGAIRTTGAALLAAALGLGGCAPPAPTPQAPPLATTPTPPKPETAASAALRAYYAQVQMALLSQGLLRTDGGGEDAPFSDRNLTENFLKVALYEEYARGQIAATRSQTPIRLQRWTRPIRLSLQFGPSVPAARQASDRAHVASYLGRLAALTGHPIIVTDQNPNFWLHFASVDERAALGPALATELAELTPGQIASVTAMGRDTFCQVLTQSDPVTSTYVAAVAVIPAEHPDLLRLSCILEELAQAPRSAQRQQRRPPLDFQRRRRVCPAHPAGRAYAAPPLQPRPAPRHDRGPGAAHRPDPCKPPHGRRKLTA